MMNAVAQSPFFGMTLTIFAYWLGVKIQSKTKSPLCNSMIIAVAFVVAFLNLSGITYDQYYVGASIYQTFLVIATACLGVSIYRQLDLLKKNLLPVIVGCVVGSVTSIASVLFFCKLLAYEPIITLSMLPKSVTTAIATAISDDQGAITSITVAAVAISGVGGNLFAPYLSKLFRVKNPLEEGLAIGACSHALGTAKAIQLGETQGAMSGLAMGLCGVITAIFALAFPYIV
ncbi:LrgB family protein [Bengtsoniella intestinalis]|uniref:LrgB family protein n=1 Tax=Bengtsoniella intestinalis TaxID=3073143 RepID=UPI00391FC449